MSNWCGWEWGFKFTIIRKWIKKLPLLDDDKIDKTYYNIEINACDPHDDKFEVWGWLYDFLKANYDFINDLLIELHWTTTPWRFLILSTVFPLMNTVWIKYFNWTCIWKRKK